LDGSGTSAAISTPAATAGFHGDDGRDRHPVGVGQLEPEGNADGDRHRDGPDNREQGTLESCVLEIIRSEETYGYAITRRLNELGFADVIEGTVYTILLRLEKNGLVQMTKRPSGMGPPRKFYALSDAGREELGRFWAKWEYLSSRIDKLKEGGK
jgi:DNA-binding PadR family transcriptional regulator